MTFRMILVSALILGVSPAAFATSGTPEQEAACRPDVRKFCHHLKEADGDDAYLGCLELNRDSLSKPCDAMLKNYGK
jgi:Cysteine rich repeat